MEERINREKDKERIDCSYEYIKNLMEAKMWNKVKIFRRVSDGSSFLYTKDTSSWG